MRSGMATHTHACDELCSGWSEPHICGDEQGEEQRCWMDRRVSSHRSSLYHTY